MNTMVLVVMVAEDQEELVLLVLGEGGYDFLSAPVGTISNGGNGGSNCGSGGGGEEHGIMIVLRIMDTYSWMMGEGNGGNGGSGLVVIKFPNTYNITIEKG